MRKLLLVVVLTGCGGDDAPVFVDAPPADAADVDAADVDATDLDAAPPPDALFCDPMLLVGGNDVAAEGWTVHAQMPYAVTYGNTFTQLMTSNASTTSGSVLLSHPVPANQPLDVRVELQVDAVDPHNQFDAAVAILGAYTPSFGTSVERSQMVYVDGNRIGWADDSQMFAANMLDGAFHVIELRVDAGGNATVTLDGMAALSRSGFVRSANIAIGDQTNDLNVNSTVRIRSVSIPCP